MAKGRKNGTNTKNGGSGKCLGICVDSYVAHLEVKGMALPSIRSYGGDVRGLVRHLGEDKPVRAITAPQVQRFLKSEAFTLKTNGQPKADLSIKKSRRAVAQFFSWLASQGEVENVPVAAK